MLWNTTMQSFEAFPMIERLNPDTVPKPASAYVQAVLHSA